MAIIPDISDPWVAILVAAAVILGGLIGSGVQRVTRFILPWDFITVGFLVFIAADIHYDLVELHKFWWFFLMLGYFFGYYLVGRQKYDMLGTIVLKGQRKKISKRYVVYYDHGDRRCIQIQRWWPLFKRLVFGVHHLASSNVEELPNDYDFVDGFPILRMKRAGTIAEWIYEKPPQVVRRWRVLKFKEFDTYIFVAAGSMVPRAALAMRSDALDDANRTIDDLTKLWMVAETKGSTSARRRATSFIVDAKVSSNPEHMLHNHLMTKKAAEEAKEKEERKKKTGSEAKTEQKEDHSDG